MIISNLPVIQMSLESLWALLGMLDPNQFLLDSGSDTTTDTTGSSSVESPQTILPPVARVTVDPEMRERSSVVGGLDINSCLQFLLELYGQLLSPTANPKTPLMQLNETIKSVSFLFKLLSMSNQISHLMSVIHIFMLCMYIYMYVANFVKRGLRMCCLD